MHYIGDQVLIQTATALQEVFRDSAIVGRLGGDEFVVFMKHISGREQVTYFSHTSKGEFG